jgi:Domain of unknown function (DUF4956)
MQFFTRLIDYVTLGSEKPIRRLAAYYGVVAIVFLVLYRFFPTIDSVMSGDRLVELAKTPSFLQDGLQAGQVQAPVASIQSRFAFAANTLFVFVSTFVLMLPVTWVYMSARWGRGYNQSVAQALIVLPMIVAGVVLIVRNSLALAFSLGGIVAAVRFRTNMSDTRDIVYIFLAIVVGFAAGVQVIMVALLLTVLFNFVLVAIWRWDFGRPVLEPTASAQWAEPLHDLAGTDRGGVPVPDRDLVLALTPKKAEALAERFERVRDILGPKGKKPKYDAVVAVTSNEVAEAQKHLEPALEQVTKRWKLDEVVSNSGKPSEIYYLVHTKKSVPRDAMVTAIRASGNGSIESVDVEVGEALTREMGEERQARKDREKEATG